MAFALSATALMSLVLLLRTPLRTVHRRLLTRCRATRPLAERGALAAILSRLLSRLLGLPAAERWAGLVGRLGRLLRLRGRGLLELSALVAYFDAPAVGWR